MYHKYIYLILMFSILFASPSFAQKRGLSKILKAVTENSVKTPITKGFIKPEGLIKPKFSPRQWRTEALKTAAKVDHFFTTLPNMEKFLQKAYLIVVFIRY